MIEVSKAKNIETKASEISYPVARRHKHLGTIVVLRSATQAIRVDKNFGSILNPAAWASFTDENTWEPVDVHIYG